MKSTLKKNQLLRIFQKQSKTELIDLLKQNIYLFRELFLRKHGYHPPFSGFIYDSKAVDFIWLNDNSYGPEWVFMQVATPNIQVVDKYDGIDIEIEIEKYIEDFKSFSKSLESNNLIIHKELGAISRFRFIIIAGNEDFWETDSNALWRSNFNKNDANIEIRSQGVFIRGFQKYLDDSEGFWNHAGIDSIKEVNSMYEYLKENSYLERWNDRFKYEKEKSS